ncbi:TadE/TadG family type IV pilus assembly protein [Streptomyces litchfieldiae]|uniref:Pilus assembly protein TadG-related protein n=1 Tax=Streptomyces litchfieldiae TaxID=3075543 RepID=A0ABU2MMQ1_9ACTN|nr:pilus assembly protein TadG-related protein [Streptomyces sp. DSM 44938]MDT0342890.1 pilus assembly protein TadG-related protein [Streptomyces sp. DSM 44938]
MRLLRARGDRGSGAIAVIFFALVVLGLAAFVVDGGLSIAQRERAADIAEQAARYAAQDLDVEALRDGAGQAPIRFGNCENRVAEYAESVGMPAGDIAAAECTGATADQVTVRIRLTYDPVFTGIVFGGSLTVWGTATAEAQVG